MADETMTTPQDGYGLTYPPAGGPRIVINPKVFEDKRDALCTAFNEGFRIWMEVNDFQPQSEPTDAQRKFFSDTAYADDELQLRRTILARIATFDTSVKDPTDDQLAETGAFLDAILESPDWCKNEWERNAVSRLSQAVKAVVGAEPVEPRPEPIEPREPEPLQSRAAMDGGETEDEETRRQNATQFAEERGMSTEGFDEMDIQTVEPVYAMHDEQVQGAADPSSEAQAGQAQPQNAVQGAVQEPGGPADPGSNPGESGPSTTKPGDIRNPIVDPNSPGSISNKELRQGDIRNPIVDPNSPGSISYKGSRPGDIRNPIVDPNSPGSIAYKGSRPGDIRNPIVDPNSPGSIAYKGRRSGARERERERTTP